MGHEAAIVQRIEGKTIDDKYLELVATEYGEYIVYIDVNAEGINAIHMDGGEEQSSADIKRYNGRNYCAILLGIRQVAPKKTDYHS